MREHLETWNILSKARNEGRLFSKLKWPRDAELSFSPPLFMEMPVARPVREMLSFSVFTPYYSETVLYSMSELLKKNEDGIYSVLPPEDISRGYCVRCCLRNTQIAQLVCLCHAARNNRGEPGNDVLQESTNASIVFGTVDNWRFAFQKPKTTNDLVDFLPSPVLIFSFLLILKIYGKQKEEQKPEAADIALLMQRADVRTSYLTLGSPHYRNEALLELLSLMRLKSLKDGRKSTHKLPGNPKLGEGKPENQNHAIIFTRGNAVQTIDMNQDTQGFTYGNFFLELPLTLDMPLLVLNLTTPSMDSSGIELQEASSSYWSWDGTRIELYEIESCAVPQQDNYFEEALKVRNLLEEFFKIMHSSSNNSRCKGACIHWQCVFNVLHV
ncbi:hypothetical protein HAX54_023865 [Datura stramonium]|uniref:Glycosyl transferase 48 domain-containing protein n=1 Tax=Datura stramonium TaxID=4076 RepID=A0ABS8RKJ6_DATST|nr:hypothetical protein [Datura stramonium]